MKQLYLILTSFFIYKSSTLKYSSYLFEHILDCCISTQTINIDQYSAGTSKETEFLVLIFTYILELTKIITKCNHHQFSALRIFTLNSIHQIFNKAITICFTTITLPFSHSFQLPLLNAFYFSSFSTFSPPLLSFLSLLLPTNCFLLLN